MNIRDINVTNTGGLIVFSSIGKYIFGSFFSSIIENFSSHFYSNSQDIVFS